MSLEKLGAYPVDGAKAREKGDLVKVSKGDRLNIVSGADHPVLIQFAVSNDWMHLGELVIPVGGVGPRASEPDSHEGDAVFYVLQGPATFYLADTDETFHIRDGESFFLPGGTTYQCLNYGANPIRAVFTIAPGL
ncbi:cupin domain-containing protein [Rhizobium sp. CNPSo 3490]|uniref:cupin domain-containing protein n=1 Tax=Rhizobium sp. CNPSo 3490 TaxID=3021407 RepID=UPI00254C20F6|nr:cupin domain-containing protein [Rhizobium sp. CNPSo 3490]MDK4731479.1 cupin domain-containing protein [Rhizobium sp. CNPSo 3490]